MAKAAIQASNSIGPPDLLHSFTEAARATLEFWLLQASYFHLKSKTPDSSTRVILLIPGFGAGDITTHQLRRFLKDKGHHTYGWDGGINTGPKADTFQHLKNKLHSLSNHHDETKVTLIGHSLGGIYARELGRAFPHLVEQIITLGSPFGAGQHPLSTNSLVRKAFELSNGKDNAFMHDHKLARQSLTPPSIPSTSIYSRSDGVVHWKTCINPKTTLSENIEIRGSHCGLIFNPLAFMVVADRLAKHPDHWTPFAQENYSSWLFRDDQAHHTFEPHFKKTRSKPKDIPLFL